jgi:hypothetical protein
MNEKICQYSTSGGPHGTVVIGALRRKELKIIAKRPGSMTSIFKGKILGYGIREYRIPFFAKNCEIFVYVINFSFKMWIFFL